MSYGLVRRIGIRVWECWTGVKLGSNPVCAIWMSKPHDMKQLRLKGDMMPTLPFFHWDSPVETLLTDSHYSIIQLQENIFELSPLKMPISSFCQLIKKEVWTSTWKTKTQKSSEESEKTRRSADENGFTRHTKKLVYKVDSVLIERSSFQFNSVLFI